ncbi:MAG: transposase, family [Patescibacteria group bacterium]|nr:transposase, family [Patescibacteria group bacterium]
MEKKQKFKGLSNPERSEIAILLRRGCSKREIAQALGRSPNTISYEVKHNSVSGFYNPRKAKDKARVSRRSRRYQWHKIEYHPELRDFIIEKLKDDDWSPDSISGYLKHEQFILPYVSTPQIYAWLYSSRGQPYCQYLFSKQYRPKPRKENKTERVMIPNRVGIEDRPAIVATRERPGDWEADTIVSGKKTHSKAALAVAQERQTRLLGVQLIPNLKPATFSTATITMLESKLTHTLSLDNGIENKQHEDITSATGATIYFCDPYSSYQKGGIENGNKMVRRYIPKSCDIGTFTQEQIDIFVTKINKKPRRCLGYKNALQLALEKGII